MNKVVVFLFLGLPIGSSMKAMRRDKTQHISPPTKVEPVRRICSYCRSVRNEMILEHLTKFKCIHSCHMSCLFEQILITQDSCPICGTKRPTFELTIEEARRIRLKNKNYEESDSDSEPYLGTKPEGDYYPVIEDYPSSSSSTGEDMDSDEEEACDSQREWWFNHPPDEN